MRRLAIAGLIAALTFGRFVLVASVLVASVLVASAQVTPPPPTQPRASFWPNTDPKQPVAVAEWYSDIPWHQKLGTYAGNEIDVALVLPFEALPDPTFCTNNPLTPTPERCMIETGINSILGTYRTDTPYDPKDTKIAGQIQCTSQPCIEVKLELSMFWARTTGCPSSPPCLQQRPFGVEPALSVMPPYSTYSGDYGAYVITDGTSYAPQMPWYMSHYCDAQFTSTGDALDPVCYADYLSTFNDGFAPLDTTAQQQWPKSQPWSVYPFATGLPPPPNPQVAPPNNHCPSVQTNCTLVMAGFDLSPISQTYTQLQYFAYNDLLFKWFNNALANFPQNYSPADYYRHFPWTGTQVTWGDGSPTDLYPQAASNPFLGQFTFTTQAGGNPSCSITQFAANPPGCTTTPVRADHYLYPRQCTLDDLAGTKIDGLAGTNIPRLRACGLSYELHHNGWLLEWPMSFWSGLNGTGIVGPNQYGRTSFLFAGVPGMQLPVSFATIPSSVSGLSVYEQVYNASIFSLYLPIANEADFKNAFQGRDYTAVEFYHTLLLTNHMESDPDEFAEGIRGRVLWHNEYRTQPMLAKFGARTFPAAFDPMTAPAPFHNYTCDGCHVRNGSGIPINPQNNLDMALQPPKGFMAAAYSPYKNGMDYTFTGEILPMKLVFFDLKRVTSRIDDSVYSKPLAFSATSPLPNAVKTADLYYSSKIMNFYGDSFHLNRQGYSYSWYYEPANSNRMVVNTPRANSELGAPYSPYQPLQVHLGAFTTPASGCLFASQPASNPPWPKSCNDINTTAIHAAIDGGANTPPPSVGFMLLNGKRLGNLGATEEIPNAAIVDFYKNQTAVLGPAAGEILWNAGTRGGVDGDLRTICKTKSLKDCYIGRFGWLGDRVSLEDQVANAAFVEMNMTTKAGYKQLYGTGNVMFPVRYNVPNCGPADQTCVVSGGNKDLTESDIDRMADYARWLGIPTRSEFTASLPDVIAGENIFVQTKCNTCHVIEKIEIPDQNDTMLTQVFRDRLKTRIDPTVDKSAKNPCMGKACPFLSYIGTDLLMHDMGYLSQVGSPSPPQSIRDTDGMVKPAFHNYVQKIRTPALKGLRFNRFVTDSQLNTQNTCAYAPKGATPCDPACDFLLHDGRACDAIEAAFLHDGPAIKKLGVIPALSALPKDKMRQLRAFLYSL